MVPVLVVSSAEDNRNITAATKAGVDGYILKINLNADILKATLDNIMMKRGLAV